MTTKPKKKFGRPPLTILWIIGIFVVPAVLKRVLGWPGPPPQGEFDASSRFMHHFMAEFVLGLPVFIPFLFALWWVNRKRDTPSE